MKCVDPPSWEVDDTAMVPLRCTTQGGAVHIVVAQENPGTQRTLPSCPPVSLGLASFGLHSLSCREAYSTQLGRCGPSSPSSPRPTLKQLSNPQSLGDGVP